MIDVKQAVQIAKVKAAEILESDASAVEEIERDSYDSHEVWSITLSVRRDTNQLPAIARLAADPLQYKRFLIDAVSGELLAIKLREIASQ